MSGNLKWRDHPRLSKWDLNIIIRVLIMKERGKRVRVREAMTIEVQVRTMQLVALRMEEGHMSWSAGGL